MGYAERSEMKKLAVVDIETTGLNPEKDRIIEIGIVQCERETKGLKVIRWYESLQDPGFPIPMEVESLTGITDADVKDQRIEWNQVSEIFQHSDVIMAHNAKFERSFLKEHAERKWACTMAMVDWALYGLTCRKLHHLAADLGICQHEVEFAFGSIGLEPTQRHRALYDALTMVCLLAKRLPPQTSKMPSVLEEIEMGMEKGFASVVLFNTPFERKDEIKGDGYLWNPNGKTWFRTMRMDMAKGEAAKKRDAHFNVKLVSADLF